VNVFSSNLHLIWQARSYGALGSYFPSPSADMLKTPWLPRIQVKNTGECGKKSDVPLCFRNTPLWISHPSFSPCSFLPVYHKRLRDTTWIIWQLRQTLSRKNSGIAYANKFATTIYTNNTIMHTQCNITMRTNKIPRICNSCWNGVGNASHNYKRYFRARRNFQQLH